MGPKRSSSNVRVFRSALKPREWCPPSPKFLSPETTRSSSKVYNLRSATKSPALYPPQTKRRTSVVASGGKSGNPKDDCGNALAALSPSRCSPNSAPPPSSCTAAKTPAQPETFSFDKIDVPIEAWNDPLNPWIDAVRDEEIFSRFYFKCFPGSHMEKYRKELEEARDAEMAKNGKKLVDLRKAWFWTDPFPDDEWEEETGDFPGSDVDKHKQK